MANLPALYAEAWTAPRVSMRRILSLDLSERDRIMMVGVTGILFAIPLTLVVQALEMPNGPDGAPLPAPSGFWIATFVVGMVLLTYYLYAGLIKFVGGMFGGTATFQECKSTSAWSQFVVGLALLVVLLVSLLLPFGIGSILALAYTVGNVYVSSAYISEAHGFRSVGIVAAVYFGLAIAVQLLLAPSMQGSMLPMAQ